MKQFKDVKYGSEHKRQVLDAFIPDGGAEAIYIDFHGGGIERGNKWKGDEYLRDLVEEGKVASVSANYRLYASENYPEYDTKFPDFLDDAVMAVKWVKDNLSLFKTDKIFIGGSSAGSYISMMLCFDRKWLAKIGMSNADISGYFHDAGQPTTHFRVLKERGLDHRRVIVDEAAPLYYIGLEESYPRMRFIVSDNDMPARYDQIMLVRSTLKYFGHENHDYVLKHGKHTAYCGRVLENGKSEYAQMILDFIKERN